MPVKMIREITDHKSIAKGKHKLRLKNSERCDPTMFGNMIITHQSPVQKCRPVETEVFDSIDPISWSFDYANNLAHVQRNYVLNEFGQHKCTTKLKNQIYCENYFCVPELTTWKKKTHKQKKTEGSVKPICNRSAPKVIQVETTPEEALKLATKNKTYLIDQLLIDIYGRPYSEDSANQRLRNIESDCTSVTSAKSTDKHSDGFNYAQLETKSVAELNAHIEALHKHQTYVGSVLIRQLRRRDRLSLRQHRQCDVITAYLHAHSRKKSEDTAMRFSIGPSPGESGYNQWVDAMKMVARLPGGIPPEFRKRLWLTLAERHLQNKGVNWAQAERACFNEWSNPDDNELGVQIVKDLHRTGCSLFCGSAGQENQALLKRVLLAYARWNKAVGYCQGFNMLAALILQVMDRSETDSVKVMIYLIEGVLPESYFANNLRGLSVDMAVFRDLLRLRLPTLSRHLDTLQNDAHEGTSYEPPLTNVFTMQWFLTLFCNCLPQETVLRVWDLIFLEGNEILLRTALAIWDRLSDRILAVNSADEFYSIMGVLTREMLEYGAVDANTLIKAVVSIEVRSELSDLRDKYLYNITPWTQTVQSAAKKGWRLFYSDDDELESDTDEKMAVATAYGISINKRKESLRRQSSPSTIQPYAYGHPDREKLALDISALKQQYAKLKERQRQAHIILTAACARQPMPHSPNSAPMTMNHLLLGKSALIVRGRRLGPPQGAVPPSRHVASKSSRSSARSPKGGETLHWKDTGRKRSLTFSRQTTLPESPIENGDKDGTSKDISDCAKNVSGDGECATSGGGGRGDSSSSYSDSDSSSTSTELCDEPDRLSDFDGEDVVSPREETVVNEPKQSDNVPDIDGTSIELKDSDTKVEAASASDIEDVSLNNLTLRLNEELPENLSYSPVDSINSTKILDADSENLSNIETEETGNINKSDWEQNVWDTSPEYSQAALSLPSPKKSLYEELEEIMALNKKADESNEQSELDSAVEIPVEEFKDETDIQLNDLDNFKLIDETEKTSEIFDTDDYTRQSLVDIDNSSLSPLYSYDASDTVSKDFDEIDTVNVKTPSNENIVLQTYSKPFDFEKYLEERVKFLKQNSVESLSSTKACFDSTEHRTPSLEEKTIEELEEKSFSEEQFLQSEENFDKLSTKQDSLDEISKHSPGTPSFKISSEFSFDEIQEKLSENLSETGSNENVTSVDNLEPKYSLEKQISLDSMRLPQLEHDAGRRHSERALRIIQENSAILHRILQFQSKSVEIVEEETKETDVVDESSILANSIAENSPLYANSVLEDSLLFETSVEEYTSLFANSVVEDSSLFSNSIVPDSSLITVANNCSQSPLESPEKDTDNVKNIEFSEVISTEASQITMDATFESADFEGNKNTKTLEDSPDSVNEKYRFTFRNWENRMEELSKQVIKLETIDFDLPSSQEHSKSELKESPIASTDETNYLTKSIYSSDLNTTDKLYSLSPEQKSEKNIDDSATALYNYKSELSFDAFSNKPAADIDWKESYQKHTDYEELYSSSEKETFSGTSSGYKTDINLSETDDNNVRCGSVSSSTTLSYSAQSVLPSKSTPYFDISVTPTTEPSRSQFISSTSPSKTFSTAISPTYTSLKMPSSPSKDQIESPPYSYSKYRLTSPFDKSPDTAQESSTYRSNKFDKSSFIDDSPECDPFKSTVSSYPATDSHKYILSSPSKIRSYAKSPTKIKDSLASSKYSYAHSDVYRSSSESPIRTKMSVETHSKPYCDLDSISRAKSHPEPEFCLDLPSQSSFKADLLRYSIKSPVKSPVSYSELSSKCSDKDKLSLEFLNKTDSSKSDTKKNISLVSPPYSYTKKQPISNFTQESYSYAQEPSKSSPDSLKSPENSTYSSKTQFRHLQFSPLSPTRKKSLSPISPQTFNPFPIRPATRQPKDVGLKLGIYKDISPLKSPSK